MCLALIDTNAVVLAQSPNVTISAPVVRTADGQELLKQARVNSDARIYLPIENTYSIAIPFIAIIEVRDKDNDVTEYIEYQNYTIEAFASEAVDVAWRPRETGDVYLRAFLISDLGKANILAPLVQSEVSVGFTEIPAELLNEPIIELPDQEPGDMQNLGGLSLAELKQYALELINDDRTKNGLTSVELSENSAAQMHADDLYGTKYNSTHWTSDGMKPYMRYTVNGGNGYVSQNVHAGSVYPPEIIPMCHAGLLLCPIIEMTEMLELSEYSMMYNDEECCQNGHRDNILDPRHTHVSLGIAYDDYYFAYVQNFENSYIEYDELSSDKIGYVRISGTLQGYEPSSISIYFDEFPTYSIYLRDRDLNSYDHGEHIAYIVEPLPAGYRYPPTHDYYIFEARKWDVKGESFAIEFSLNQLMEARERGVYTFLVFAEDIEGSKFPVTSYSIFKE
jgi:uncharacterized protein YkwD